MDKRLCYLGDTQINLVAASQVAVLRGDSSLRQWVKDNNPCETLFDKWGLETEASRAAVAQRELDEDYNYPDDMSPTFVHNRKMYNALCRNADTHDLNAIIRKPKLNHRLMSLAHN